MSGANLPPVHILVTPLGSAVDIIQAPLDKWNPEIIFAFTSMLESIKTAEENLRFAWNSNCGPNGPPEIKTVIIEEPWQSNTIEDVMSAFDEMVESTTSRYSKLGRKIDWHVSITGGTNLMAIGMALSASTHLFPVYYVLPGDKYPKKRSTPSQLVIDIPLFEHLGPAVRLFQKSPKKGELFELIHGAKYPLTVEQMAIKLDKTRQAIYPHLEQMGNCRIVVKGKGATYQSTTTGSLAYDRWKGNDRS